MFLENGSGNGTEPKGCINIPRRGGKGRESCGAYTLLYIIYSKMAGIYPGISQYFGSVLQYYTHVTFLTVCLTHPQSCGIIISVKSKML